jgi:hypothetical protein
MATDKGEVCLAPPPGPAGRDPVDPRPAARAASPASLDRARRHAEAASAKTLDEFCMQQECSMQTPLTLARRAHRANASGAISPRYAAWSDPGGRLFGRPRHER